MLLKKIFKQYAIFENNEHDHFKQKKRRSEKITKKKTILIQVNRF